MKTRNNKTIKFLILILFFTAAFFTNTKPASASFSCDPSNLGPHQEPDSNGFGSTCVCSDGYVEDTSIPTNCISSGPPGDPGNGPGTDPGSQVDHFKKFIDEVAGQVFPNSFLGTLETLITTNLLPDPNAVAPNSAAFWMKNLQTIQHKGYAQNDPAELAHFQTANTLVTALLPAYKKLDPSTKGGFPNAVTFLDAYIQFSGSGTGTGTGAGTGGTGGGGGGGQPPTGSCVDTSSVTVGEEEISQINGAVDGKPLYIQWPEVSTSQGIEAPAINEVGPLLILSGQSKTLLVQICNDIRDVDKNVAALKSDIALIRDYTKHLIRIDDTTVHMDKTLTDLNSWLKQKELTDDPQAWKDAKSGIDKEATDFANLVLDGRSEAIKENVPRTKLVSNGTTAVLTADPTKAKEKTETYTPDINIYEADARKNAGLLFVGELKDYFLNNDLSGNPGVNKNQTALLQMLAKKAQKENSFNNESEKFNRLGTEITNPVDAERYISSLYDAAVTRAGQNAVSEFVAGNTFIGAKTCAGDEQYVDTYSDIGKEIDANGNKTQTTTVICKKNSVKIVTPAPIIRDLAGKFGAIKLDIAVAADEKGETADVSGIVDAVKNGCPSGKPKVNGRCEAAKTPPGACGGVGQSPCSNGLCDGALVVENGKCVPNITNCGFGKHSDPADPTKCIDDNCLADEAWDVTAGECKVVSCGSNQHWNKDLKQCDPGPECGTDQIRDTHGVCIPTGPGGCNSDQHWNNDLKICQEGPECSTGQTRDTHGVCIPTGPGGCDTDFHWNDVIKQCVAGPECNTDETRDSHGVCQPIAINSFNSRQFASKSQNNFISSNMASVGIVDNLGNNKTFSQTLNLSLQTKGDNGIKKTTLTFSAGNASACLATSDWPTFVNPVVVGLTEPSTIFKEGDSLPTNDQTFQIVHPRVFDLEVNIKRPEGIYVYTRQPLPQTNILSSVTNSSDGLSQKVAYTPDLTNVQIGDVVTLRLNNAALSTDIITIDQSDVVNRLVMEATAGQIATKRAFADYSFKQSGNILIVSNKTLVQNSIPSTATYSLECNVNNKAVTKSVNIVFP
ncbi:MAG: hypothetical protein HY226_06435 [Candidatus Vogelbacteria bacterium]|nr:hypothetical protein [Candidatus Vogelbacteria bacterium]